MRTFVALELPHALRNELSERAHGLAAALPSARWVVPENLHLTLVFLGEVAPERHQDLRLVLARACSECDPFALRLGAPGAFPPRGRPRVLWVGLSDTGGGDSDELRHLQQRVDSAARGALDLEPEDRPFRPHVTLARLREPGSRADRERFEAALGALPEAPFEPREVVLFESRLGSDGPSYRALDRFRLGTAAEPGSSAAPAP